MRKHSTAKVFCILLALYALLALPAVFWSEYLNSPMGLVVALPFLSIYLLHALGLPGLLQSGGACGWGWCAPTVLGWATLVGLWLGLAWLLARGIAGALWPGQASGQRPPPGG